MLDGWQLSGDTACVSGDWAGASDVDDRQLRLHRRRRRHAAETSAATRCCCASGNCDPTPGGTGSYFNIAAFSRPTGRGDIGNAPVTFYRLPKIVLSNMSIFKNFQLGGGKRIQFRWEAYNVFNQVNWSTLNTTAQFNPAGEQVNASFGQADGPRTPASCRGRYGSASEATEQAGTRRRRSGSGG